MQRAYQSENTLPKGFRLLWYEILSLLGQGSFGVTYLAFDHNLERETAIKEFLPREFASRDYGHKTIHPLSTKYEKIFLWGMERFMGEARTLARFRHPNIVRVYTVFEANNTAYMVMEYEQGDNLDRMFKKGKLTSEKELIGILIPLLNGLNLMHSAHFIHRDIKPANIYIRKDGSPVLIDFGSARQALGNKTRVLTTLVTPGYAPYEQYYESEKHQGAWSDIYALAATVYLAISGKAPMDALKRGQSILSEDKDPLVPAVVVGSNRYSHQFLAAIDRALMFKEIDRPQSTMEWKQMLLGGIATLPRRQEDLDATIKHKSAPIAVPELPQIRAHLPQPQSNSKVPRGKLTIKRPLFLPIMVLGVITSILLGALILLKPLLWDQQTYGPTTVTPADENQVGQQGDERREELLRLITESNERLGKELWRTTLARYQKVLEIDPGNDAAQQGITRIAHYHVDMARQSIEKGDLARAKNLLAIAETIIPNMGKVQVLKDRVDELERSNKTQKAKAERSRAEVHNLIGSIEEAQIRLTKAQSSADKVAAKIRARTAYNQAEDDKNQSIGLISQAKRFNQEENYNEAQAELKRVLSLIAKATKGYMTAQNVAKIQIRQEAAFNKKRARLRELESLVSGAQRETDATKTKADDIETKIHAQKPYQDAQSWNKQSLDLVAKAREFKDRRDYDKAIDALTLAISLFNKASTGYDFARKLAKDSIELSSKPEPFTVHDFEVVRSLLHRFKQAFEQYDLQQLEKISTLSAQRRNLLKMIFQEYRDIEVSISDISMIARENTVSATVTINKLHTYSGDQVIPSGQWRQSKVTIYKKGGKLGKINW
jgi:serine/threonine protein kinase